MVIPPPWDKSQDVRQQTYLRALETIPGLTIHNGQFRSHIVKRPLASSPTNRPRLVEVIDTKDKGSDVNLATYALVDSFRGLYDIAVIVSNDVDLKETSASPRNGESSARYRSMFQEIATVVSTAAGARPPDGYSIFHVWLGEGDDLGGVLMPLDVMRMNVLVCAN